ncbi:hypothetical protein TFLX_04445 [Thermoflexales bacterium]|nr:hypothetical protein TFLX_04445 [Thermoflexales bacterium]
MLRLMKFSPIALIVVVALLAACTPASRPGGINCKTDVCVDVQLSEPIRFNEPVTVTITVETEKDETELQIGLFSSNPTIIFEGGHVPGW